MAGDVCLGGAGAELFAPTKTLASNYGLYNGFLVAGLVWALLITDAQWHRSVGTFFLGCVAATAG